MSLAGNVRELFALIDVDRSLLLQEVIHLCNAYGQVGGTPFYQALQPIKHQAASGLRNLEQVSCEVADTLLRDLLRITHYEHAC
jgi:hypothetical protein